MVLVKRDDSAERSIDDQASAVKQEVVKMQKRLQSLPEGG
jgi:hypothetical protein